MSLLYTTHKYLSNFIWKFFYKTNTELKCSHKCFVYIEKCIQGEQRSQKVFCDRCKEEIEVEYVVENATQIIFQNNDRLPCTKTKYLEKKLAQEALNYAKIKGLKYQPKRIYFCSECRAWHMTKR